MFTHTAGQRVDFEQEGILPGGKEARYLKTSSGAMLFLGPILGLAYVMLMPVMGVMTILALAVQKIFGKPFMLIKNMVSFGWRPNEAYLRGKSRKKDINDRKERPVTRK